MPILGDYEPAEGIPVLSDQEQTMLESAGVGFQWSAENKYTALCPPRWALLVVRSRMRPGASRLMFNPLAFGVEVLQFIKQHSWLQEYLDALARLGCPEVEDLAATLTEHGWRNNEG